MRSTRRYNGGGIAVMQVPLLVLTTGPTTYLLLCGCAHAARHAAQFKSVIPPDLKTPFQGVQKSQNFKPAISTRGRPHFLWNGTQRLASLPAAPVDQGEPRSVPQRHKANLVLAWFFPPHPDSSSSLFVGSTEFPVPRTRGAKQQQREEQKQSSGVPVCLL